MKTLSTGNLTIAAAGGNALPIGQLGARGAYLRVEGGDGAGVLSIRDNAPLSDGFVATMQPGFPAASWLMWVWVPVFGTSLIFTNTQGADIVVQYILYDEPPDKPQGDFALMVISEVLPALTNTVPAARNLSPYFQFDAAASCSGNSADVQLTIGQDGETVIGPTNYFTFAAPTPYAIAATLDSPHPIVTFQARNTDAVLPTTLLVIVRAKART